MFIIYLQTPHFPPSFEQCLQYLQFLHALQFFEPVQVALFLEAVMVVLAIKRDEKDMSRRIENNFFIKAGLIQINIEYFLMYSFCIYTESQKQNQRPIFS